MGGFQLVQFYTIWRVSPLKLLARPLVPTSLRRYSKENYEHHAEEKAPTTEEEFIRVAEEMAEEKEQGFKSQTVDKAQDQDGMKEATTTTDSNFESVRDHTGDESDDLLKSIPQNQISS